MNLIDQLKSGGILDPVVLETKELTSYPEIYLKREADGQLTDLEPNFNHQEGLLAYLKPWKHIIGIAIPYGLLPKNRQIEKEAISSVSIMAWEWDYHQKIRSLLQEILGQTFEYELHVDQGPLPERSLAMLMGIAEGGRSQMLIHPKYGTAFHLAFILTTLEENGGDFEIKSFKGNHFDNPELNKFGVLNFNLSSKCSNCRQCQLNCPTKALTGEADFNGKRCISAITQKKGLLSDWEMKGMGRQLYGCDLCQLSCPVNSPLNSTVDNILSDRETVNRINPMVILAASQKSFVKDFGHMGFSWRGLGVTKRNALINLGNYGSVSHLEALEGYKSSYVASQNEVLDKTAQWAIHQIKERHQRKGTTHEGLKSIIGN